MSEQDALLNELRLLLTDRFLDKLAIAVRVIADLDNRIAIERFVCKVYAIAGKQEPDLTPYIEQKQAAMSDSEIDLHSLMMRGFL